MQKYVFAFTSVLEWVSEWVGDSFGCDAIVSPSLLHLFLHLPRCLIGLVSGWVIVLGLMLSYLQACCICFCIYLGAWLGSAELEASGWRLGSFRSTVISVNWEGNIINVRWKNVIAVSIVSHSCNLMLELSSQSAERKIWSSRSVRFHHFQLLSIDMDYLLNCNEKTNIQVDSRLSL